MSAHQNESQNSFLSEDFGLKNTEPQLHGSRFMRAIKRDNVNVKAKHINETIDHHQHQQYLHQQQHSPGSLQEDQKELSASLRYQDDAGESGAHIPRRAKNIYNGNDADRHLLTSPEETIITPILEEPCSNKCPNLYRCNRCRKPFTSTNPPYLVLKRDKTTITGEDMHMKSITIANSTFSAGLATNKVMRISIDINVTFFFAIIFIILTLLLFFYNNTSDFIKLFKKMGLDYYSKYK
uniref:Uncharacterized protein n=1 Tax=Rhodnius prolixus TaxID=13249 RepID=T1I3Y5_RHOPR